MFILHISIHADLHPVRGVVCPLSGKIEIKVVELQEPDGCVVDRKSVV